MRVAWAAGLFEGEGCFYVKNDSRPGRKPRPVAALKMTDEDVVKLFLATVRYGTVSGPHKSLSRDGRTHKPVWTWRCTGDDVLAVYDLLLPWLGERRRHRGMEVLREAL